MRRTPIYLLGLTFFGLTPDYRGAIFKQIHEIVFYGKGGYSWDIVYNMPIWLRNFTFQQIKEHYDKENSQNDSIEQSKKNMQSVGAVKDKNAKPSYVTKASKK